MDRYETSGDWDVWGDSKYDITKEKVLRTFSTKELLDMIDDEEIQLYLRNKKLKKLRNEKP